MASPTVYKWTDPGAPQITYNSVSAFQNLFQKVLIDGYGDKLPPGTGGESWSIPFSDAGSFILKQGGTQDRKCCIKLYNLYSSTGSYGTKFRIRIADDFSSIDTPVGEWVTASSNNFVDMGCRTNSGYHTPWIIFATKRTIICLFGSNNEKTDTLLFDTNRYYTSDITSWMFGDYAPIDPSMETNQMVVYNYLSSTSYYDYIRGSLNTSGYNSSCEPRPTARGNANGELGAYRMQYIASRKLGISYFQSSGSSYDNQLGEYPNKIDAGLYMEPSRAFFDNGFMGTIPGVLFPLQKVPFPNNGVVPVIPGSGNYSGSNLYFFSTRCYDSSDSRYYGQHAIHDGEWGVD